MSSIFFNKRWGKFFLSLRIFLTFSVDACTYMCPFFLPEQFEKLLFLLWNFDLLSSSLNSLGGMGEGGGRSENLTVLGTDQPLNQLC